MKSEDMGVESKYIKIIINLGEESNEESDPIFAEDLTYKINEFLLTENKLYYCTKYSSDLPNDYGFSYIDNIYEYDRDIILHNLDEEEIDIDRKHIDYLINKLLFEYFNLEGEHNIHLMSSDSNLKKVTSENVYSIIFVCDPKYGKRKYFLINEMIESKEIFTEIKTKIINQVVNYIRILYQINKCKSLSDYFNLFLLDKDNIYLKNKLDLSNFSNFMNHFDSKDKTALFNLIISKINLFANIETMSQNTFNNYDFTNLKIPDNIRKIEEKAFVNCQQLKAVYINRNLDINKESFFDCNNLIIYTTDLDLFEKCNSLGFKCKINKNHALNCLKKENAKESTDCILDDDLPF